MNSQTNQIGSHPSEPVRTPENPLEYEWLTVDQAVAFCAERGLSRTPKTLRKWAERSYNKEDADIIVRRADTMWGYRWKIEVTSLTRKVEEELSLASAHPSEPVRTGANTPTASRAEYTGTVSQSSNEPVRTGADEFGPGQTDEKNISKGEPGSHPSEPVRTRLAVQSGSQVEQELRDRLKDKDDENAFLREQLKAAQAEVGKRANSTDEALKTIDRVVRSFEMQAEANKALALGAAASEEPSQEQTQPINFTPRVVERENPVSVAPDEPHVYQHPATSRGDV